MSPDENMGRQRRAERYAGEFLAEPSMSAPMPIPEKPGRKPAEPTSGAVPPAVAKPEAPAVNPDLQMYAEHGQPTQQPPWSQHYASQQQYPQQWPQGYPAPQATGEYPQQWPQSYPGQQGYPQQWSQSYPAQQPGGYPQQWSQSVPVRQPMGQQWSQSVPVQQGAQQTWQGTNGYAPPLTTDPSQDGGDGDDGDKGKIGWKTICVIVAIFIIGISGSYFGAKALRRGNIRKEVGVYDNLYCEGVYVDGVHLGGMTKDEAAAAVNANAQERMNAWGVDLRSSDGQLIRRITAADLGMTVDVKDALNDAWQAGHSSDDDDERRAEMKKLKDDPYVGYTVKPSGDTSLIDAILQQYAQPVFMLPQNATVEFIPEAHSYPFEITPEVNGRYLDVDFIKDQIYEMVETMESGSVEMRMQTIPAEVTAEDLRQTRVLRGKATTDISTTSTEERTGNIQRAFELINGTVLKPGQSFSFNGVVGARSAKNGFLPAIEYAYGNERLGYGGGVCQASTTVYLAAVRGGMTITHREPHSDKVNYTAYGLDATVNLDGKKIDLTFKNETNSDAYVMAYLVRSGGRWVCHVDIYGEALPDGVTYDLVAETVEVIPAPVDPEYVEDKKGEHVTYIDETPVQKRKASDGYIVETFRVEYLNGVEVNRTFVARDTYKAKAQQLWVGIEDR